MRTNGGSTKRIAAITRTVPDLDAAAEFYHAALGFEPVTAPRGLRSDEADLLGSPGLSVSSRSMKLGRQTIELLSFDPGGAPYPADSTASDLWFQHCAVVVADMDAAFEAVSAHRIQPISIGGPQQLPPNTGGVRAFKFRDPFGHPLELLWFPPGTGDAAWDGASDKLFRGIDHTAIAVSSAAASARFYQDVLGLSVAARSFNRGVEQERLDAVEGDAVDVVALAPAQAPPHLELLGYRVGSRRPPRDRSPADASIARTWAVVDDLAGVVAAVDHHAASRATLRRGRWRGSDAVTFRDPDGHTWICTET